VNECKAFVTATFNEIPKEQYAAAISKLRDRYTRVIEKEGDWFEREGNDSDL